MCEAKLHLLSTQHGDKIENGGKMNFCKCFLEESVLRLKIVPYCCFGFKENPDSALNLRGLRRNFLTE